MTELKVSNVDDKMIKYETLVTAESLGSRSFGTIKVANAMPTNDAASALIEKYFQVKSLHE